MTRENRDQLILIVLSAVIFVVVAFYLVLRPQYDKMLTTKVKLDKATSQLNTDTKNAAQVPNLRKQCADLEQELNNADTNLIVNSFDAFLQIINDCSSRAGMQTINVGMRTDLGAVKRGETYVELFVNVESAAPYHKLGKWFCELEKISPYVRVVDVKIRSNREQVGLLNSESTISFLVRQGEL